MQSVYRTILEVEIRHDYFQLLTPGTNYPKDYNISDFIDITPSLQTAKLMRDHRMIFKVTATGFTIYAQAEFINAATGYATLIDIDPDLCLSFYWSLRDYRFVNYTNQRLRESAKRIYYFSNRSASQQGGINYLNNAIPAFGTTYPGESAYHLGDIIRRAGQTMELIEMESSSAIFPPAKWQAINSAIINYVNPFDRLLWQSPYFHHQRPNANPGEFISYQVFDANGLPVELGNIPGTNLPQSEYRAPLAVSDPVNYTLDLGHLEPGKYSIQITEIGGPATSTFYLLNPAIHPELFAVSEFYVTGAAAPFQFIKKNAALQRWIFDDPFKIFLVRFRNRLTRWRYINQDQTLFHQTPVPRPLTKTFSNYQIVVGGNTVNLPDPAVDPIIPEIDAPTNLLKNIYSQIFLTS